MVVMLARPKPGRWWSELPALAGAINPVRVGRVEDPALAVTLVVVASFPRVVVLGGQVGQALAAQLGRLGRVLVVEVGHGQKIGISSISAAG